MPRNKIVIESVKFKNFISHDEEVEVNFKTKYEENEVKRFFLNTLTPKPRSKKSKEGILKILGFIGKNASYKSSILKAIYKILLFLSNFQKEKKEFEWELAANWDYEQKHKIYLNDPNKMIKNFQKFKKKDLKDNCNEKKYDQFLEKEFLKNFYITNCFNKNKPLNFEIIFWKNHKRNIFTFSFFKNSKKIKWIYSLNNENTNFNESILSGLKLNLLSKNFQNVSEEEYFRGDQINFYVCKSYQIFLHWYFQIQQKKIN